MTMTETCNVNTEIERRHMAVPASLSEQVGKVHHLTRDDLIEVIKRCREQMLDQIKQMAAVVWEFKDRKVPLDLIRKVPGMHNMMSVLEAMAEGRLIPETYWNVRRFRKLKWKVSNYPITDQERLARNDPIEVVTANGELIEVRPSEWSEDLEQQVAHHDHLRTPAEQRQWIDNAAKRLPKINPDLMYEVDWDNREIICKKDCRIPFAVAKGILEKSRR